MINDLLNLFFLNEIALYGLPTQIVLFVLVITLSILLFLLIRKKKPSNELHLSDDEQSTFLKSILDHSGTSSAILDSDGFIRYVNFGFEALFNAKELPLTGKNISDIPQLSTLDRSLGDNLSSVVTVQGSDGVSYLIKYFTVKDSNQQVIGRFLKMLPDIKHSTSTGDYDLSHELKTPLHAVLGFSELLKKDTDITAEQEKLLEKIIYHSKQLDDKIKSIVGSEDDTPEEIRSKHPKQSIKKILVVDDVSINRTLLKLMLKRYGIDVEEASNGEAALKVLESWKADMILMDLSMPVMDGLETVKVIRSNGFKNELKIIAVTATQRYSREELVKVGFDDLMQKPFKEEELMSRLGINLESTN